MNLIKTINEIKFTNTFKNKQRTGNIQLTFNSIYFIFTYESISLKKAAFILKPSECTINSIKLIIF
ncbi:hypothetical protein NK356_16275 [Chryseobacterium sp. S0630]|uniref:hypothetical protein n=1 Tax=Chryseobacterium sp. S0630 TaxID=2957803 RepID=UPI00209F518F|nr:hypothetical protein [Chryseobacterium sp. S0630]MCP1300733.1 hypothetical protein [Chryseobacterium sp. S0630]